MFPLFSRGQRTLLIIIIQGLRLPEAPTPSDNTITMFYGFPQKRKKKWRLVHQHIKAYVWK